MSEDPSTPPPVADPIVTPTATPAPVDNTVAFVCYLTLIGFIVAIVINKDAKKNQLGNFHLRQMLGLWIAAVVLGVVNVIPILGQIVFILGFLFLFVLWVIGFMGALNRREKAVPLIGGFIQEKLKGVFN